MFTTTNKQEVLIGKSIARTGSVQINDATAAAYIADGEVLILDEQGVPVAAPTFATAPKIMLVQRSGANAVTSNLIFSSWIDGRFINAFKGTDGTAAVEQVTTVGYNGTTGSIDVTAADEFLVKIQYKHDTKMWSEQQNLKTYQYYSTAPTQAALCSAIAKAVNEDEGRMVSVTMFNGAAGAAIGAAADTVVGAIGSTTVTITDVGSNNTCFAIAAGDYFRPGTGLTDPVYLVTASTATGTAGGVLTLNSPLQATVNLVGNTSEFLTAASVAAANSGMTFTGLPLVYALDQFPFMKTMFNLVLKGFGTTTAPATTTQATKGNGTGEVVAEHEYQAKGDRGALNRNVWPLPSAYAQVDADWVTPTIYDTIFISHNNGKQIDTITGQRLSPQEIYLYLVEGASQTTQVLTALNTWMASVPGAFPNITT